MKEQALRLEQAYEYKNPELEKASQLLLKLYLELRKRQLRKNERRKSNHRNV